MLSPGELSSHSMCAPLASTLPPGNTHQYLYHLETPISTKTPLPPGKHTVITWKHPLTQNYKNVFTTWQFEQSINTLTILHMLINESLEKQTLYPHYINGKKTQKELKYKMNQLQTWLLLWETIKSVDTFCLSNIFMA
jgi:FtsZ-binding cell division protein ZapB